MIGLKRNESTFWYALYKATAEMQDVYGNDTGDPLVVYEDPVQMRAVISPANGWSDTRLFGNLESCDKVIVLYDMDCPIDENTVLCVDKEPTYNSDGQLVYDYVVKRVAKSMNIISIAIQKVGKS